MTQSESKECFSCPPLIGVPNCPKCGKSYIGYVNPIKIKYDLPQYGHVGIVTGCKILRSPCHKVRPRRITLPVDGSGFEPFKDVCSACGKEYNAIELKIS